MIGKVVELIELLDLFGNNRLDRDLVRGSETLYPVLQQLAKTAGEETDEMTDEREELINQVLDVVRVCGELW